MRIVRETLDQTKGIMVAEEIFCPTFNLCAFLSPAVMKFSYSSFRKYKKLPLVLLSWIQRGKSSGFLCSGCKSSVSFSQWYVTIVGRNSFVYLLVKYRGIFSKEKEIQTTPSIRSLNSFRIFISSYNTIFRIHFSLR